MWKAISAILLFSGILVFLWFKDGYILGTAEDGLIFYKISHYKPEADFAWMEHPGLGRSTLYLTASKPTYTVLSWIQDNGISGYIIQAGILWFLLVSSGIGVYLLTREFFPKLPKRYLILSAFFYWFNPISLVIWNRFLLNYLFFLGMLPLVSLLFIKGLQTKKYIWAVVLILLFPLYSYSFSYFAFFILLWLIFFLWTLLHLLVNEDRSKLFYVKYFLFTLILFILTNSWWISQLVGLNLFKDFNSNILNFNTETNLGILNALSKKMGSLSDIFRLSNASFFQQESLTWVKYFYSIPIIITEFLVVLTLLYSIIRGRKNASVLILAGLFFTGIFLAKGTNPPFGEVYKFIYERLPFFQIFRNPFEKFGFILALSAAPLLSFGVFTLANDMFPRFKKLIFPGVIIYVLLIWGSPFYMGLVFTSKEPPANNYAVGYKVKVPQYYYEADKWLKSQGNNFRFIGFPLGDEGITYNWEKGYSGVELSTALFSTPGILHNTAVPYYNQLVPEIEKSLLKDDDFYKLANILNARFFFVREDIDFKLRKMTDPQVIKQNLISREGKGEIRKIAEFGKLAFWENLTWKDSTFYSASTIKNSAYYEVDVLLDYDKINSTEYMVHIENAKSPFVLVFSELFNSGWEAFYEDNGKINDHFRANKYANGWLIERQGTYDLKVEFVLQRWLEIGEKISVISTAGLFCILIYSLWKRKT